MSRRPQRFLAAASLTLNLGASASSYAQPAPEPEEKPAPEAEIDSEDEEEPEPVAEARDLARKSLELLEKEDYAGALERARRAEELYHAPIHLRVMGQALEGLGRLAEAAEFYERLAAEPLPETAHPVFIEAQELAQTRLAELISRLPALLVEVGGLEDDEADEATATLDGEPLVVGIAVRLDPGEHVLRVTAPGRVPVEKSLTLREGAGVVKVQVPMRRKGEPASEVMVEPQAPAQSGASLAVPGWVLLGLGGVSLAAGAVTGGMTLARAGDLEERCPDRRCLPAAQADFDTAVALGWTSTIALGVGGALAAAGAIFLIVDGSSEESAEAPPHALQLEIGPTSAAVRLRF